MAYGDGTILEGLNKVYTGKDASFIQGDSGGPVYIQHTKTTAQAVGHISVGLSEPGKKGFYYMTLKKIFNDSPGEFRLMTANNNYRDSRDLQSSSQTEVKQEAQIEVPPKR